LVIGITLVGNKCWCFHYDHSVNEDSPKYREASSGLQARDCILDW
jgi:hypothetical protein